MEGFKKLDHLNIHYLNTFRYETPQLNQFLSETLAVSSEEWSVAKDNSSFFSRPIEQKLGSS